MRLYEHYDLVNKTGKSTVVESNQASIARGFVKHLQENEIGPNWSLVETLWNQVSAKAKADPNFDFKGLTDCLQNFVGGTVNPTRLARMDGDHA